MWSKISIQQKLTAIIVAALVISLGLLTWLNDRNSRSLIEERLESKILPSSLESISNKIEGLLLQPVKSSQLVAENAYLQSWIRNGEPESDQSRAVEFFRQVKSSTQADVVFYVSSVSNKYYTQDGVLKDMSASNANDQWFYGFLGSGLNYDINLDYFEGTGPLTLFVNYAVKQGGQTIGAAGLGLSVDELTTLIREFRIEETGYVFVADQKGNVLIHPDKEQTGKALKTLTGVGEVAKVLTGGAQFNVTRFVDDGAEYVAASYTVPTFNYRVIAVVPQAELYGVINAALIKSILLACVIAVIFIILAILTARAISQPIRETSRLLNEISKGGGDLTTRLDVTSEDELGVLCESFNAFEEKLCAIISEVSQQAEQLMTVTNQVKGISDESATSIENQKVSIESVASAITEMGSTVQEIASNANTASGAAVEAKEKSSQGQTAVRETIGMIQSLACEMESTSQVVNDLGDQAEKIGGILNVIRGISEQTNLLALNAAIEAARAGEAGRGFAVVADEVRGLAKRTAESTDEIAEMIDALQGGAGKAVEAIARGKQNTENSVTSVNKTGSVLEDIFVAVEQISDINFQVATATEEQSHVVEDITKHVVEVETISSDTFDSANRVRQLCAELTSLSETLTRLMANFKTG
ncbi:methyl-accepting chemotaxis protein [Hahella ganghwensis]|uniref:methyl-accepting chemotaxis protein n=1 Tax=Hahella ganghwensis TaxID=286420 RepID=UPI00036ED2F1|nr:methyl-accepting chemotaxis protein [Hahella ganghwensis]